MLNKKNALLASAILSSAVLMGCSSTEELEAQKAQYENQLSEQQAQHEAQMMEQNQRHEEQIKSMEAELQHDNELLTEMDNELKNSKSQYIVKKDDHLNQIAKEHGITLDKIIQMNPQIENPDKLFVGDVINVRQ